MIGSESSLQLDPPSRKRNGPPPEEGSRPPQAGLAGAAPLGEREPDLAGAVLRAVAGEPGAFEALFRLHHPRLRGFVFGILKDADMADDAAQEAWIAIFRHLPRLKNSDAFVAWSFQIARNAAYQQLRRKRRLPVVTDDLDAIIDQATAALPDGGDVEALAEAMDHLTPIHREVLILKYMEGLSYDEIAGVMGISTGTVRSRLHYAKKWMRGLLGRFGR